MKVEKFKVLLYLKKSGLDKSGKAPIMGRITVNRTMAQFSCKLSCTPELWNPRESRLNGKSKEAVEVNAKIDKLLLDINAAFDSLLERKSDFDAVSVKDAFQGSMNTQMTLLKQFRKINEDLLERVGIDRAYGTYDKYRYTLMILEEFVNKKLGVSDIAFGQLTERFIWDFQEFVLDEKKQAVDTLRHYLVLLKKVCRTAYKEGHSEKYHFCNFKLPKQKVSTPKALTHEEFVKVRDLEIPPQRASIVVTRDLFLFACFTGTSYADTVSITRDNLSRDDMGALWLKYRRKKNELRARVKLLPEAIALMEKYRDDKRETPFPKQLYSTLRGNMKILRVLAGIESDIVYHAGRHSFASLITLGDGVPIETISKMLGHSNIQTTQIYARVTPRKLFEDMNRFIEATGDLQLVL